MPDFKPCPCGKVPKALFLSSNYIAGNDVAYVRGSCCAQWFVQFKLDWHSPKGELAYSISKEAWNNAPRSEPPLHIGWLCPACGRGNAPLTETCSCKGWPHYDVTCTTYGPHAD